MTSIFVAKLDFGITSDLLKQAFQEYGTVLKASVATDRETGKSRGFGFVEMADREEAENAIKNLDGSLMNGRPIAVKEAEQRTDSRPPRDPSAPRPEFNKPRPAGGFQRSESKTGDFPRPDIDDSPLGAPLIPSPFKNEVRKKEKKVVDRDVDSRSKKPKMDAYKKSGKNNRFFEEDNDEDWDDNSADNLVDSNYDEDNDEDYDEDNEEDNED